MLKIILFCKSYISDLKRFQRFWDSLYIHNVEKIPFYVCVPKSDLEDTLEKYVAKSFGKNFLNLEDKNLERHILDWLFCGGWYASEKLTEKNFDSFRKKTICILNEKYFSCMLNNKNIKIANILSRGTFSWYKNKILCKLNISIIR